MAFGSAMGECDDGAMPPDPHADRRPPALALMGPTASGKTAFALELAGRLPADLISVDSALVFRGMDIGTAKPDAATLARFPHALVDIRDPHESYSAAEFARDARAAIDAAVARGRIPLLVGGTGLYFHALLHGLSPMPETDPALRAAVAAEAAERGWEALHAELAQVDPEAAARIHSTDPQRIGRAIEVYRASGRPLSDWQRARVPQRLPVRVLRLVLAPTERAVLHERIARRFDQMLAEGFLDEVQRLRQDKRLHRDLPAIRAVGYRQAWEHMDGETDAATFRERAIFATRQLAKRQLTWLRGELAALWFDPASRCQALRRRVDAFLD
jgi:tRNA dimethylallyltransferase